MGAENGTTDATVDIEHVLLNMFLGIMGSLAILFNGFLLFVLWRNKSPEFRTGTTYVIGNLALADCLTGVAVLFYIMPFKVIHKYQVPMVWTTIEASMLNLMVMSVERLLAFTFPFTMPSKPTLKRTFVLIGLIWLVSISCGVAVHFCKDPAQFGLTVVFEISVLVFLIVHGVIFGYWRRRNRQFRVFSRDFSKDTARKMKHSMHSNLTKVVLILILIVIITLLPYMIGLQLLFWSRLKLKPAINEADQHRIQLFVHYFYPIELINFVANPVVFAWRLKRYRKAFLQAFACLKCLCFARNRRRSGSTSRELTPYNGKMETRR